jgi:hypothetical protein
LNDKTLGYTIMVITILIMVGYFVWSFAVWFGTSFTWLAPYIEWAYKLPILAAAYLILLIILWIGYTMTTTPPPIPLETLLDIESGDEKKKEEKNNLRENPACSRRRVPEGEGGHTEDPEKRSISQKAEGKRCDAP